MVKSSVTKPKPLRPRGDSLAKYPWADWFKGATTRKEKQFVLVRGRDFDCELTTMSLQLRLKSRKLGYQISIFKDKKAQSLDVLLKRVKVEKTA